MVSESERETTTKQQQHKNHDGGEEKKRGEILPPNFLWLTCWLKKNV